VGRWEWRLIIISITFPILTTPSSKEGYQDAYESYKADPEHKGDSPYKQIPHNSNVLVVAHIIQRKRKDNSP
jgi:hypothetical protein